MVTATENGTGGINFVVDVEDTAKMTGDLRALYFHFNEAKLPGLTVTGGDGYLTEYRVQANKVLDLGDNTTMSGAVKTGFDVGIEFGTNGAKPDDLNQPIHFTLSRAGADLTLDDIAKQVFGAKLDAIGGPGGPRNGASKLVGTSSSAPDAKDDNLNIFEDGASGLNDPSKTPHQVTLNVLSNDTDGDNDALKITDIHDGPSHGTLSIAVDGKSLLYTPNLDYSGTDTFRYCVSDGHGGEDNAVCTVNIAPVADDPQLFFTVTPGATINESLITVTAIQNDGDGSEFVDKIVASGAPAGVTVTPLSVDPAGQPDHITQQFKVTTQPGADVNFDLKFTATAQEKVGGDTETADKTQKIEIDFTHNASTLNYSVQDQSIWNTGDAFTFHKAPFLGLDFSLAGALGEPAVGTDLSYDVHLKTGFQADITFQAGDIDANVPVDVTVDTTYNKTTDQLLVDPTIALGSGGSFTAHGPEGDFKLDFIFQLDGHVKGELLFVPLVDETFSYDKDKPLFDLDSQSTHFTWDVLPGVIQVDGEFPHITTTNDPGTLSGHGESQDFLTANLDIDQAANELLGHALQFIDPNPIDPNNFELLDADLIGALKMVQDLSIGLAGQTASLTLEDGTVVPFTFGTPLVIDNASSHDANHDGHIGMNFNIKPQLALTNTTGIDSDLSLDFYLLKNLPDELGGGDVFHQTYPIDQGSFTVFNDTFDLAGVSAQNYGVVA